MRERLGGYEAPQKATARAAPTTTTDRPSPTVMFRKLSLKLRSNIIPLPEPCGCHLIVGTGIRTEVKY